jgi:hypothetical protein
MSYSLFDYMKGVQRLCRDGQQKLLNPEDIIEYVNKGRRMVARRTQCLRFLTPISGQIQSCSLLTGGSGYTNPTLVITAPDFPSGYGPAPNGQQATGVFSLTRGVITDCEITNGGFGYFQPRMSFTDPTGTGATVVPNLTWFNTLLQGQEVYNFSSIDLSTAPPGYGPMFALMSATVLFSDYRYILPRYDFTHYQALIRNYAYQFQYVPGICSQFGQGSNGSLYVYPQPNQTYQMEWDCICDPQDLLFNEDVEAIPNVWTDAVEFYAAHLAFLELQNFNASRGMLELFEKNVGIFSKAARPSRSINPYGRT